MRKDPRHHIYERDNWTCQYCGRGGIESFEDWNEAWLAIDHIMPKKHGGSDEESNLVVACHTCNSVKAAEMCSSIAEAKEIIARKNEGRKRWFQKFVANDSADT
ncbi:HNH endonuclease [Motiliproteus sp. SC1-56]|uniref:HNH endonuclease n=1 Tax=Motiliproteus sp. SC1-56 TaxID=2799565 RepID=UPI001A8F46D3|nr:HNH endonuclease [Motiliproteus sp. SC1-56]